MTEPREPEAVPEGEAAAPEEQPTTPTSPSTGNWYPVNTQPAPEPETAPVPEEVGEERADRREGPSESEPEPAAEPTAEEVEPEPAAEEEPAPAPVPEEVGEERADRHEGPSESEPEPAEEPPAEPAAAEEPEDEVDENEDPTVSLPGPDFAMPAAAEAAAEATERVDVGEDRPTSASTPPADAIFRQPSPTSSASPEPTTLEPLSEEEQRLAAERAARRDARAAALAAPAPEPVAPPKPVVIHKRTNDRFWGSLGLFLLRLVLAGIFTIRGLGILTDIPAAQAEFAKTVLADYPPGPQVMAIITGVASLLIALSLVLGLLTRVAGLGIALIAGGALVLVYWGPWSPFVPDQPGFLGEYQLLLAAMGILLMCIGGGGWSLDRSFRAGRERDRRERAGETE